jgi:anti-sigma regulatory factor (Ser/Thr protein kinase)
LQSTLAIAVTDPSQVGEARRAASSLARGLGLTETECGTLSLIVTEAANNLVKHAREGALLLRLLEQGPAVGIEVLALDKGPGMPNLEWCLRDGSSTAGTPGTGLGAIARLSTFFDVYSTPETGTALVARLWSGPPPPTLGLPVAAVNVPLRGEEVCGDAWAVQQHEARQFLIVADGLGHGPLAADAARAAVRTFLANLPLGPAGILERAHAALRSTRGAAVAVAEIDVEREVIRYAGIGNIAGTILASDGSRSMISHNGIVGHESRTIQELTYPFPAGATLVMASDGLGTRWGLGAYPGLVVRDLALIAGVLYRDFQRGRDDATVLVARPGERP